MKTSEALRSIQSKLLDVANELRNSPFKRMANIGKPADQWFSDLKSLLSTIHIELQEVDRQKIEEEFERIRDQIECIDLSETIDISIPAMGHGNSEVRRVRKKWKEAKHAEMKELLGSVKTLRTSVSTLHDRALQREVDDQKKARQAREAQRKSREIAGLHAMPIAVGSMTSEDDDMEKLQVVRTYLKRFSISAKWLSDRPREDKADKGFEIVDEYDVQDLLYALLKPVVSDLDREDPTPKIGGDSGRVDLSSQELGTIIEVKYAKNESRAKAIPKECRERTLLYSRWPDLRHLLFFVYDPRGLISDPDILIRGHTKTMAAGASSFDVRLLVSPWETSANLTAGYPPAPEGSLSRELGSADSESPIVAGLTQPVYFPGREVIIMGINLANRSSDPVSLRSVTLSIEEETWKPITQLRITHPDGWLEETVRLDAWGACRGAWCFGVDLNGAGSPISLPDDTSTEATIEIVPVRGEPSLVQLEILPKPLLGSD